MPSPFYNAIKGTTAGTPGTGAFTPNAASSGFRAWSNVPSGWVGLVRYEDGAAWELSYSYWNATTLSRAASQWVASSTGSALSLTSSATAAMVADASEVMSHLGGTGWYGWKPQPGGTTVTAHNIGVINTVGTGAAVAVAATNFLTEQLRVQYTSATTANAQAGWHSGNQTALYSTSAGRGGFEFTARFGASQLPTGPRLFVGLTSTTFSGNTGEPSALTANYVTFAKDSTDTNIQLLVNSNAGSGTKTDTGIALVANGWYEAAVWAETGGGAVAGLLIRLDTGEIWLGSTSTDIPANGALLMAHLLGGLNGTNTGTAFVMHAGGIILRSGV